MKISIRVNSKAERIVRSTKNLIRFQIFVFQQPQRQTNPRKTGRQVFRRSSITSSSIINNQYYCQIFIRNKMKQSRKELFIYIFKTVIQHPSKLIQKNSFIWAYYNDFTFMIILIRICLCDSFRGKQVQFGFLIGRIFEYKVGATNLFRVPVVLIIYLPPKMNESTSLNPKVNSLMDLFLKREASQTLIPKKINKKVKQNEDKLDPLSQILSWRDDLPHPPSPPTNSSRHCSETHIPEVNPTTWGTDLQGIFMNVDWKNTSMESFKQLTLTNEVLSNGMVFVWGSKTNIGELLDHFEQMGYVYAQNFAFVLLSRSKIPLKSSKKLAGNTSLLNFFSQKSPAQVLASSVKSKAGNGALVDYEAGRVEDPSTIFLNGESQYFSESQRILYMFRKINKKQPLELRHQRTSDVYFTIGEGDGLDWKAKEVVYKMIETLLINANYKQGQPLKLMQLWADAKQQRKGWIMVSETTKERKDPTTSEELI